MAKIIKNSLFYGFRGKFGNDFVLRTSRNGKTILAACPVKSNKPPSERQQAVRNKFRMATLYAKEAIHNPALCEFYVPYLAEGESLYQLAVKDFLKAPVILMINCDSLSIDRGGTILVFVKNDYETVRITVCIKGVQLYEGLQKYFQFYNTERLHQSLDYRTPQFVYQNVA